MIRVKIVVAVLAVVSAGLTTAQLVLQPAHAGGSPAAIVGAAVADAGGF